MAEIKQTFDDCRRSILAYRKAEEEAEAVSLYHSPVASLTGVSRSDRSDHTAMAAGALDDIINRQRQAAYSWAVGVNKCLDLTELLPDYEDRAILSDRFINAESYEDIAKSYGLTYDHVRKRIRTALSKIKKAADQTAK